MAFNKVGTPTSTISVLKQDGKTSMLCAHCKKMTESEMSKRAFALGEQVIKNCEHCGKPL